MKVDETGPAHMMRRLSYAVAVPLAVACGASLTGCATPPHSSNSSASTNIELPVELKTGTEQTLDDVLVTRGDETWRCERADSPAANKASNEAASPPTDLRWIQTGSAGTLVDRARQNVGKVLPGGYFVADDGSFVKAEVARQSQVDANTLTWALFSTQGTGEPTFTRGRFAGISSIQRIDTVGGLPPNPRCTHEGLRMFVPYSATYLLYRAREKNNASAQPHASQPNVIVSAN
ncbi:DUF3455 domain-containing protein [Paraburkholderia phosphatilytica]|uniref:DUF3455 domain-containing protein n=1 Tax=Paraburkholderia phosphatilytica TaxID=2282883 RepID=UPI0013DF4CEE|nr:DUF3455 domain-containing protein [Paraburkholderia phosphatilytica]